MPSLTTLWDLRPDWLISALAILHLFIFWATIVWILMTKNESTSAVAWCLIVILVPYVRGGSFFSCLPAISTSIGRCSGKQRLQYPAAPPFRLDGQRLLGGGGWPGPGADGTAGEHAAIG